MTTGVDGTFQQSHLLKMKEGLRLFNRQMYWECHEELEDHWLEDTSDNARYVYWAVIQVATSLFHYRQDNLNGAKGMLSKARHKLDMCEKLKVETGLLYESINWAQFKKLVRAVPEDSKLDDYKDLYVFRFKPDPTIWEPDNGID